MYNDELDADEQITAEEGIASLIFDTTNSGDEYVSEEMAADLGRKILFDVLQVFRPDLIAEEQSPDLSKEWWVVHEAVLEAMGKEAGDYAVNIAELAADIAARKLPIEAPL